MKTTINRYEQTVEIKDLDINLNGIQGVDAILDMIKDTIDEGNTEDAKDWITQLQDELYDSSDDDSSYDDIICYRCGRPGHKSNECYAQKHKKGYWLD